MDTEEQAVDVDRGWNFIVSQFVENVDGFDVVKTTDKFGCYRYYWKCRDDSGKRKTSNVVYDTPKECMIDFLRNIEGFWFG